MGSTVTLATPEMAERISQLVHLSFLELAASDWEPNARQVFLGESSPAAIATALKAPAFAAVETQDDVLAGFILMRKPSLLAMLFVHPGYLHQGIARRLWEAARAHVEATFPETKTVELNSTPYAVGAYRSLGFVPISTEFEIGGCRATRMACWLPGRALGADAL
jgi:GNAT superfamily N-acetyltransferase